MKISFAKIENPTIDPVNPPHRITGVIVNGAHFLPVSVERRLSGFHVELEIRVDGILLHSSEFTPAERIEFDALQRRAHDHVDKLKERHRAIARTAAQQIFGE